MLIRFLFNLSAQAMVEIWGPNFMDHSIICGDSAGVFWALGISLKRSPEDIEKLYLSQVERAHREGFFFGKGLNILNEGMKELLKDPEAYKKIEGKFSTATTEFPFKHRRYWSWNSNDDLSNCMHGSLHVPMYTSYNKRRFNGKTVVDGAYSMAGSDLPHGDDTLFVGIDPHADVTRELTYYQMIFPPSPESYAELTQSGYDAMKRWNGVMKKKVGYRFANYQALIVFWPLKVFAKLLRFILWMLLEPFRLLFQYQHSIPLHEL